MNFRHAWRTYRRTPLFSIAATLVLGVAIAIAAAIFSLYSHLQLQPVAGVQDSARLVAIGLARDDDEWIPLNVDQHQVLVDAMGAPDAVFGVGYAGGGWGSVTVDGNETDARAVSVSRGFFAGLGVAMLQGVELDAASADPAAQNAVISDYLWEREFGRSPRALGATVALGEAEYTIVGVAGGGFRGLRRDLREDIWVPVEAALTNMEAGPPGMDDAQRRAFVRRLPMLSVYARADLERLREELPGVTQRLREEWQGLMPSGLTRLEALPGSATNPRAYRTLVRQTELLAGGAVLILLVASLNLASFFLSRAPAREQELRTRLALGATRGAVARQLFAESALLVAVGSVLGLILHVWVRAALLRLPPFSEVRPRIEVGLGDWRVFAFLVAAAAVVAAVAGLAPAVRAAFATSLTATTVGTVARRSGRAQPLLALQVLAATLVVLAGTLFVGEIRRLDAADYGFVQDGLYVAEIGFDREAMRAAGGRMSFSPEQGTAMMAEIEERLGAAPGFAGFAAVSTPPLSANSFGITVVELPDVDDQRPEEERRTYSVRASDDYFSVLGVRVVGRTLDGLNPFDAVVSREFARRIWGTEDVIGRQFRTVTDGGFSFRGGAMVVTRTMTQTVDGVDTGPPPLTVVGVADDVTYEPGQPPQAVFYVPVTGGPIAGSFVLRGTASPEIVQPLLDEIVRKHMMPRMVESVKPMAEIVRDTFKSERARSRLATGAALMALALTMIGLYASMQHSVESRRAELAVRKALGASDDGIARLILHRALTITALGVVGAALLAVAFRARLGELLFGLAPTDPRAWLVSVVVVFAIGLLAAWLPARRAGRVDPAVALRYE